MALTTTPKPALFVRHLNGGPAPILDGFEKATSTWKKGAFLIDDDSGYVTESTTDIDASAVAKRTFGFAINAATGTTGSATTGPNVTFIDVTDQVIFEGTLSDATAGTHTLAIADMHKVYPIKKSTHWYLDANAVSDTGGGRVVGFKDPIGTVDGRVYFIVTNTARGGANTGSGTY